MSRPVLFRFETPAGVAVDFETGSASEAHDHAETNGLRCLSTPRLYLAGSGPEPSAEWDYSGRLLADDAFSGAGADEIQKWLGFS